MLQDFHKYLIVLAVLAVGQAIAGVCEGAGAGQVVLSLLNASIWCFAAGFGYCKATMARPAPIQTH